MPYSLQVWKFPIEQPSRVVNIEMPVGARPLYVDEQRGTVCLWALVNPAAPKETRRFRCAGTGHPINEAEDTLKHVGSWQMRGGAMVFHLFEIVE